MITESYNLPADQKFELFDRVSEEPTSISELTDVRQMNGRHFDLVLLNGIVKPVEEPEQDWFGIQNHDSTNGNDSSYSSGESKTS